MKWSESFIFTLREAPKEAEIASHQLMIRACLIKQVAGGIYTYLPMGWRVLRKIEQIVREELDRVGCQELFFPVLSPAGLWQESGRWDVYGPELMRLTDRHDREFALGPTHEEVISDTVRNTVRTYRNLPFTLYQIQVKFRDEIRPRFGVMRAREFTMMDAYSFHADAECLNRWYEVMSEVYTRIFKRCGLKFRAVLADSGAIGGKTTHEFMVLADTGESRVLSCPEEKCGYAATSETAEGIIDPVDDAGDPPQPIEEVSTPNAHTVKEVCSFLNAQPSHLIKTLIYRTENGPVAALIRGDREICEPKLRSFLEAPTAVMADAKEIEALTGAEVGFSGPVGLKGAKIIADRSIAGMTHAITGANKTDAHLKHVNVERDLDIREFHDLAVAEPGDRCPQCNAVLTAYRGIEVGQIFQLGTKYSEAMKATFMDAEGGEKPFVMGCYGIGIPRTAAAAIEQRHDENGIQWPLSIAPFHVLITSLSDTDSSVVDAARNLYETLSADGIETLWDDRSERPGVKFKDADLIGIPYRVTVGARGLKEGIVEFKDRFSGEMKKLKVEDASNEIELIIQEELDRLSA